MTKSNKRIIVFIPARGGSKGIQNKNIKEFAKKPLITHTLEYAFESKLDQKTKDQIYELYREDFLNFNYKR